MVQSDALVEGTETATLTLSNPTIGIALGTPATGEITLLDNDYYLLTLAQTGSGSGIISGGGIKVVDTPVTLTASAATGSTFAGWSAASFTMPAADLTCTATFTLNSYSLTMTQDGTGDGVVGGGGTFPYRTTVTPTATPSPGSRFGGWTPGYCGAPFNLYGDTTCTATFIRETYTISTSVSPAGGGRIQCSKNPVSHGASSTCTGTANSGYRFSSFGGDCSGSTCELTNVTSPKSVTGDFIAEYADLQVSALTAPSTATIGGTLAVAWTCLNDGANANAATDKSSWDDQWVLSTDAVYGNGDDRVLGRFRHTGVLGLDAVYSDARTLTLPIDLAAGSYYLLLMTDSSGEVREDTFEGNNVTVQAINLTGGYPDLVVEDVQVSALAYTETGIDLHYRVRNLGLGEAIGSNANPDIGFPGSWQERAYLSSDASLSADDRLIGTFEYTGTLLAGHSYDRNVLVTMPQQAGDYRVLVQVDVANHVFEIGESNNTTASAGVLQVESAYTVAVETPVDSALAGTPIPMTGKAVMTASGAPAIGVPVKIHLEVRGMRRLLSVTTDGSGGFGTVFTPLPSEAGNYTLGAAHPGETTAPVQDAFVILGMRATPAANRLALTAGQGLDTQVAIENFSATEALQGLTVEILGQPASLTVTPTFSGGTSLGGGDTVPLDLRIEADRGAAASGDLRLRITTGEGVQAEAVITLKIAALTSRLEADPTSLSSTMVIGGQRVLTFNLRNAGGVDSGPIDVLVPPGAPWLTAGSALPLPSLEGGAATPVTIVLTPPAGLGLGTYTGGLTLQAGDSAVELPFDFRAISNGTGTLDVQVVDEYFYYDPAHPPLAEAKVRLTDYYTNALIGEQATDSSGVVSFTAVLGGYYLLEVHADEHTRFTQTIQVEAGTTTEVQAFLSRESVRYVWTVRETGLADEYVLSVDSVFEADVPTPVVVFDPPILDLAPLAGPGQSMQIDLSISNHGLIAARDVLLTPVENANYRITPLVNRIDELPAKTTYQVPVLIEQLGAVTESLETGTDRPHKFRGNSKAGPPVGSLDVSRTDSLSLSCVTGIVADWQYTCAQLKVTKEQVLPAKNFASDCVTSSPQRPDNVQPKTSVQPQEPDDPLISQRSEPNAVSHESPSLEQLACGDCEVGLIKFAWETLTKISWTKKYQLLLKSMKWWPSSRYLPRGVVHRPSINSNASSPLGKVAPPPKLLRRQWKELSLATRGLRLWGNYRSSAMHSVRRCPWQHVPDSKPYKHRASECLAPQTLPVARPLGDSIRPVLES